MRAGNQLLAVLPDHGQVLHLKLLSLLMPFVGYFAELEGNDLIILSRFLFQILGLHDLFLEP